MKKILIIKHGALGDIVLSMHAIFSIKNQTIKDHEIIVVDNNSADFSVQVASKYSDKIINVKEQLVVRSVKILSI